MQRKKWLEQFFRFGLASKGFVYLLFGALSVMAAVGLSSDRASKNETVKMIYEQPFGKFILLLLIIGIAGYVALRAVQAIRDTENKGTEFKAIIIRVGYGISALIYLGFAYSALELLLGNGGSGGNSRQLMAGKVLNLPGGKWILALVGIIVIGSGINQLYKGISGRFMKKIKVIQSKFEDIFRKTGVAGYISRGIVLVILGYLLAHGALNMNPQEGQSTEQAFSFLEYKFGSVLMAIVALGLVAYGVFMFVKAKYQQINVD